MINLRGKDARRKEWLTQLHMSQSFERGLTTKLRNEFRWVAKKASVQYATDQNVDILEGHRRRLEAILKPYVAAAIKTFGARVRASIPPKGRIGTTALKLNESEMDSYSAQYIRDHVMAHVNDISKTTASRIADVIASGREDELSYREIADNISAVTGGDVGDARAETIARTEMHSASQAGSQAAAEDLEIPGLMKKWLTVGDDRVRPDHESADGQMVNLDEDFTVGDEEMTFPGDPTAPPEETINCRCVVSYEVP